MRFGRARFIERGVVVDGSFAFEIAGEVLMGSSSGEGEGEAFRFRDDGVDTEIEMLAFCGARRRCKLEVGLDALDRDGERRVCSWK